MDSNKHIKSVIIAHTNGLPLVSVKVDKGLDENIIAPFFSAMQTFSDQNIGKMDTSRIKAGNLDLLYLRKHKAWQE